MKTTPNTAADKYRTVHPTKGVSPVGSNFGFFLIPIGKGGPLRVIASDGLGGDGWEHVSVSLNNRCPTWDEMHFVKDLFWSENETVLQFHPPKKDYVNRHPYVLHLWRKIGAAVELPPKILI